MVRRFISFKQPEKNPPGTMFAFHKKEVLLSSSKDLIQGHAQQQRVCFSMGDDPELVIPLSPPTLSSK
jgi:hypothetical protein